MSRVLFAAAADDDTGASDLAGMFADAGVSAVLVLDVSDRAAVERWSAEATAVVFATGTRALPAPEAYTRTVEAVRLAKDLGARTIATKYCSTFDSTAEGNIGPSLDALLDETGEAFTIALPALPVNGRTTYFGYHFVKGRLLSDSPMRNHPLTPMTDPDLVHHLGRQTKRRVGLTPIEVVERGAAAIRAYWRELQAGGIAISIVDCLSEAHAAEICEAASELRVVSGGSAFGRHLPAAWHRRGWLADEDAAGLDRARLESGTGTLVVAGSCSVATTAQNEWLRRNGATVLELDPVRLVGDGSDGALREATGALRAGATVLLKTQSAADDIARTREWGKARGWDHAQLGLTIARSLAELTAAIIRQQAPGALICAGGETSTAICRAVGVRALAVGRNIQPGVPLCVPIEGPAMPLILKSGNFGTEDFYSAASGAAAELRARASR